MFGRIFSLSLYVVLVYIVVEGNFKFNHRSSPHLRRSFGRLRLTMCIVFWILIHKTIDFIKKGINFLYRMYFA